MANIGEVVWAFRGEGDSKHIWPAEILDVVVSFSVCNVIM
jgi:hypothetical protein